MAAEGRFLAIGKSKNCRRLNSALWTWCNFLPYPNIRFLLSWHDPCKPLFLQGGCLSLGWRPSPSISCFQMYRLWSQEINPQSQQMRDKSSDLHIVLAGLIKSTSLERRIDIWLLKMNINHIIDLFFSPPFVFRVLGLCLLWASHMIKIMLIQRLT